MNAKTIGGIMMLLGTCVGAGMLALPIAAAHEGFILATALLSLYLGGSGFVILLKK